MTHFRGLIVVAITTGLLFSNMVYAADPGVDCFNNPGTLSNYGQNIYQTQSACSAQCAALGLAVWATTQGRLCYCGNEYPTTGEVSYDTYCTTKCLAWPAQFCRTTHQFSISYVN